MSKTNNQIIYNTLDDVVSFSFEQLESEKVMSFKELNDLKKEFLYYLNKRLKDGSEKYEQDVPIFSWQKIRTERDNLNEALEEYIDALVYQVAEMISIEEYSGKGEYERLVKRSMAHLVYAYFLLRKAKDERAKLNINQIRKGRRKK